MEGKGGVGVVLDVETLDILTLGMERLGTSFVQISYLPASERRRRAALELRGGIRGVKDSCQHLSLGLAFNCEAQQVSKQHAGMEKRCAEGERRGRFCWQDAYFSQVFTEQLSGQPCGLNDGVQGCAALV